MGACVSRDNEELDRYTSPSLDVNNRWAAFNFLFEETPYICIYDFQESYAKFVTPLFPFPLAEYSCICKSYQIFIAGGVNLSTNAVVSKTWSGSLGGEGLELKRMASMQNARRKPFLVCPMRDGFLAVAGYYHPKYPDSISKDCEKYIETEDRWEEITPLNYQPKSVFAVSHIIYAFREFGNQIPFERLNVAGNRGWEVMQMSSNLEGIEAISDYCVSGAENKLYIFGGTSKLKDASGKIYSIDVNTRHLKQETPLLERETISIRCCIDTEEYFYSLTKDLKLCVFNKTQMKWVFMRTSIHREAHVLDLSLIHICRCRRAI
eukprot:TRINITY_DN8086_c0_g1_i4.p1 TRINITY_DN8086_c0_g1~~TRINITY_DN8086_c0_g1_i4.p1  ORF type:complete len:321 (-),score=68.62 TRINITY_DN8086_c0_g1_i4:23-985(-)